MSDWYRSGRDVEPGRYGSENRERRDFDAQERWRGERRAGEQRSFGEGRPSPERGGYTGESFGGPDFMPQDRGGWDFRGENYRERGMRDERWRGEDERRRTYGAEGRPQDWGHSYAQGGQQRYGERGEQARYGQGGGVLGVNPPLQRITDGETEHGLRENMRMGETMRMGEHRGRGPKNYTRSDERIREDINDRLSDDSWLDASEIEVQVSKCEATLTGTVHSRDDKRRAEDLAEQVSGVKHVQNNLRVEPHGAQTGAQMGAQTPQSTQSTQSTQTTQSTQGARDTSARPGGQTPPIA